MGKQKGRRAPVWNAQPPEGKGRPGEHTQVCLLLGGGISIYLRPWAYYDLKAKQLEKRMEYGISKPAEGGEGVNSPIDVKGQQRMLRQKQRIKKQSKQKNPCNWKC